VRELGEIHRQLLRKLADGRLHSGVNLAGQLGVSRSGIWNAVRDLQTLGLEINALPGTGYRLDRPLELLEATAIEAQLAPHTRCLLQSLHIHDVLDSTNTFLMQAAREGLASGAVCLAETQTKGRGRLGRSWQSPFAGNVYLSVLWYFANTSLLSGLSLAAGTVLIRLLRQLGAPGVGLKWPNDILWNEHKLGGILVEVSGEMHGRCAVVVGIGLNCNIPHSYMAAVDQASVDLRRIPGVAAVSRNALVAGILNELLPVLAEFERKGFGGYREEWRRYHTFDGRAVTLDLGGQQIHGLIVDVTESGALLVDCDVGGRREFVSGDVRLRVAKP